VSASNLSIAPLASTLSVNVMIFSPISEEILVLTSLIKPRPDLFYPTFLSLSGCIDSLYPRPLKITPNVFKVGLPFSERT